MTTKRNVLDNAEADGRILLGERIRIRLGRAGARGLFNGIKVALLVLFGLVGYLLAFFFAIRGIPNLMAAVQQGTGVRTSMPIDVVIAGWIAPSLFFIAVLFVLYLLIMRQLWRLLTRLRDRIERGLFSLDEEAAPAAPQDKRVTPPAKTGTAQPKKGRSR